MTSFLLYLFEASLVLGIGYAVYRFLLQKETFFAFNRFFLISILLLSLLLPLISFEFSRSENSFINQQGTELGQARSAYHLTFENWSEGPLASPDQQSSGWQQFWSQDWDMARIITVSLMIIYLIGFSFRLIRLMTGYMRIYQLKKQITPTEFEGLKVAEMPSKMAPFSFLDTVYIPQHIEDESEYVQILAHEKTHIRQRHSIDLIFGQLVAALLWFNPLVWLLLKSLKQTHEYIADQNMLRQGFSLVEYQALLLRQLINENSFGLAHHFNLSFIKKRMAMMSIKKSGWSGWSKAMIALSLVLLMGMMTVQSNALLGEPTVKTSKVPQATALNMKFYIDEIPLSMGLQFSRVKSYMGDFKFAFDNSKNDNIHISLDLMHDRQVVANISYKLEEGSNLSIRSLLDQAQKDDYLVVDIIDGPPNAAKLYNIPLFREGKGWKKNQASDLPPPPVALFVGGTEVGPQKGVSLTQLKAADAQIAYEISEFVDFGVIERQAGNVKATLVRNGVSVLNNLDLEIKRKASININKLLSVAKKGDEIMVQFGKPDGLRFGSKFSIE